MERYEDYFAISIFVLVIALLIILTGCFVKLSNIKNTLQAQFDYQTEIQFCMQEANKILAPCYLEMDTDGQVHWYYNANEGRM